jgi:hypothetical protein
MHPQKNTLKGKNNNMLEQMMIKKTLIFISAFILISFTSLLSAGEKGEGITCINKGSNVTAVYDKGSSGTVVSTNIKVGNSYKGGKCMGRCGGACGGWAPSAWAKDCLDHDICIVDQDGKNDLANDKNCGDEFRHAADDYAFGVLRGCRG